jgi:16S rRNA (guanine527-N7)-methyltransferase
VEPHHPDRQDPTDPLELLLREGVAALGLPEPLARALARLCRLLDAWNQRLNLTGHRGPEMIAERLVLDALALATVFPVAPERLVDLGSGAGFPALPLALAHPDWSVTLVEAREKRHHFQRAAIRELGIANARPLLGRAEALPAEPHDLAIAQAVAPLDELLRWAPRWVRPEGCLVVPGPRGRAAALVPGLEVLGDRTYRAPARMQPRERVAWVARLT